MGSPGTFVRKTHLINMLWNGRSILKDSGSSNQITIFKVQSDSLILNVKSRNRWSPLTSISLPDVDLLTYGNNPKVSSTVSQECNFTCLKYTNFTLILNGPSRRIFDIGLFLFFCKENRSYYNIVSITYNFYLRYLVSHL